MPSKKKSPPPVAQSVPPPPARIILYLKPPALRGDGLLFRARLGALKAAPGQPIALADFTQVKDLDPGATVTATFTAGNQAAKMFLIAITWPTSCSANYGCEINTNGKDIAESMGVTYLPTQVPFAKTLRCTFEGTGCLTVDDERGGTLSVNLNKSLSGGICLTFAIANGDSGDLTFVPPVFGPIHSP